MKVNIVNSVDFPPGTEGGRRQRNASSGGWQHTSCDHNDRRESCHHDHRRCSPTIKGCENRIQERRALKKLWIIDECVLYAIVLKLMVTSQEHSCNFVPAITLRLVKLLSSVRVALTLQIDFLEIRS